MNIVCPNCDALYLFHSKDKKVVGQNFKCSQCAQKWFQYNFYEKEKIEPINSGSLKQMALEEYKISKSYDINATITQKGETQENMRLRLEETSESLETSKQTVYDERTQAAESPIISDNSTIIGFLTASLIFTSLSILYVYNDKIQKFSPQNTGFLSDYRKLVDHGIWVAKDLINLIYQIVL